MTEISSAVTENETAAKREKSPLKRFVSFARDLIFPPRCVCCQTVIAAKEQLCGDCREEIEYHRVHKDSFYSGAEMAGAQFRAFDFDGLFAPFFYEAPIKNGLLSMKFAAQRDNARFFALEIAKLMPKICGDIRFDAVCFVPLSESRLKSRGFDQSRLIALYVSQYTGIPLCENALKKIYDAPPQHEEKLLRRFGNVFGAYEAQKDEVNGKTLLLVDDIATTGATLGECAKMLMLSGAARVICAAAAVVRKDSRKSVPTRG